MTETEVTRALAKAGPDPGTVTVDALLQRQALRLLAALMRRHGWPIPARLDEFFADTELALTECGLPTVRQPISEYGRATPVIGTMESVEAVTATEAAHRVGVTPDHIRRLYREHSVRGHKSGGTVLVEMASVHDYFRRTRPGKDAA